MIAVTHQITTPLVTFRTNKKGQCATIDFPDGRRHRTPTAEANRVQSWVSTEIRRWYAANKGENTP